MTVSQKFTEILRWVVIYCPYPALRIALFKRCRVRIGEKTVVNFVVNIIIPMSGKEIKMGTSL